MAQKHGKQSKVERAYPDSVRRVKPPKMTMPKTLTALPMSQYPTALEFVSGNELDRAPAPASEEASAVAASTAVAVDPEDDLVPDLKKVLLPPTSHFVLALFPVLVEVEVWLRESAGDRMTCRATCDALSGCVWRH